MTLAILTTAVFWLAWINGANDNFKGVATLYGSGTAGYRRALLWATLADMKAIGRKKCQIGWIGPAEFYVRACGAVPGPEFVVMRKNLRETKSD